MTENEFTYRAFLSFSEQDNCAHRPDAPAADALCWGDWLPAALQSFPVPPALAGQRNARGEIIPDRINSLFSHAAEPTENTSLSAATRAALEQSACLVVICSPRSAQNSQVNEAVRYFKQLGRAQRILPLVIAGEPFAADGQRPGRTAAEECFVPALRHPVKPDGTLDTARREAGFVFADVRHSEDQRELRAADQQAGAIELATAKIQLLAGILGVGFSALWGHEIKRLFAAAPTPVRAAQTPAPAAPAATPAGAPEVPPQMEELRAQAQAAEAKMLAAQEQAQTALGEAAAARLQVQVAENQRLAAENQLAAAQQQVRAAQAQLLENQNLPADAQREIQAAQAQARAAQSQCEEAQRQTRAAESQVEAARQQAREWQQQFSAAEQQVRHAQSQLDAVRQQAQAAASEAQAAQQQQARDAQNKIQQIQEATRDAQQQIQAAHQKAQTARRLTKIFAVLAVLAALAASLAVSSARRQRPAVSVPPVPAAPADTAALNREQIQQALQQFAAAPATNALTTLAAFAARIPAEEIPATLTAATVLDEPQRNLLQEQLLGWWLKTNAPAAFDWTCQATNAAFQSRALAKILPALPAESLTNALAQLKALPVAVSESLYPLLFQNWAAQDPVVAMAARSEIPGHDAEAKIFSVILAVWKAQQPAAAVNWLVAQPDSAALPAGAWRDGVIAGVFADWAAKDLASATAAGAALPAGAAKDGAVENILRQQLVQAPAAAAEVVKNLPVGDFRQQALAGLCLHWTPTNVLAWTPALAAEAERIAVTNRALGHWAQTDPRAATDFAAAHPELPGTVFGTLAQAWGQQDLAAATNWVGSLPAGDKKDAALLALMEPWAQADPQGLANFARTGLPAGELQDLYLTAACQQLAPRDLTGTLDWLQTVADAGLRQKLLELATRTSPLSHLPTAAKLVAALPPGEDQQAALRGLLANWSAADPAGAANWLLAFPATNAQPAFVAAVLTTWAQSEPAVAARWLAQLPAGTASDDLLRAFLTGAATKYPAYAAEWTLSVPDETQRQQYQLLVARQWRQTDPAAARKWTDSLPWPEALKATLP